MKRVLLIICAGIVSQLAIGQVKEGKIIYERKLNLHKRLTGEQASMRNMVPEFNTSKVQLVFAENESVSKQLEEEQDIRDEAGEPEGGRRVIRMGGGANNELYKNYAKGQVVELRELGPKKYVIEDSIRRFTWKLDDAGTKTIKGYACKKATTKTLQGMDVVAWYTDQILCASGPENFGGLPGMILELNIGDGEIVFTPLEIIDKGDQRMVKAPTGGKKITREEFQKMMDEQFGPAPAGGGPQIRVLRQ